MHAELIDRAPQKDLRLPPLERSSPCKIAVFGLFGQGNLGNECTALALLANLRTRLPGTEMFLICSDPAEAAKIHAIPAISYFAHARHKRQRQRFLAARVFSRLWSESKGWLFAFRTLRQTSVLIMTGTGMLTDYNSSALGRPYEVFKWALAARMAGCKVRFISVGVGPLRSVLSRWFFKAALQLADYRSFRDEVSHSRLTHAGFRVLGDRVFPDLAFSLPQSLFISPAKPRSGRRWIGVGVMDYDGFGRGKRHPNAIYSDYLDKTCAFVQWLLGQGCGVRILLGDLRYDQAPRTHLRQRLQNTGCMLLREEFIDEDINSTGDLLQVLREVNMVISPRFHNQVLALMLGKPVISISYDAKSDALLQSFGLGQFCHPIEHLNLKKLIAQFYELERTFEKLRPAVLRRIEEYRHLLDEQYRLVLAGLPGNNS